MLTFLFHYGVLDIVLFSYNAITFLIIQKGRGVSPAEKVVSPQM